MMFSLSREWNAKVEQLTKICLNHEEEKGLIVKDPLTLTFWTPKQ